MFEQEIKSILKKKQKELGIISLDNIKISKLGLGENNLSMLVQVNKKKFVFRIGLRKYSPKFMKREFAALKRIPKGFGPLPILHDGSKKLMKYPYSILTYMPGKHLKKLTKYHLKEYAKRLAIFHKKTEAKRSNTDLYKMLMKDVKEFVKDDVKILSSPYISNYLIKMKEYVKQNTYLFNDIKFVITHTDLVLTNILWHKNNFYYIDWEWSKLGDPAVDLAHLFNLYHSAYPWRIKLNGDRLDCLISSYRKVRDDKTIKERAIVLSNFMTFLELLHILYTIKHWNNKELHSFTKKHYIKLKNDFMLSLDKMFN